MSRSIHILKTCKDPTRDHGLRSRLLLRVGGKGYLPTNADTSIDVSTISRIQCVHYVEKTLDWIASRSCMSTGTSPESEKRPCPRLGVWCRVLPDVRGVK